MQVVQEAGDWRAMPRLTQTERTNRGPTRNTREKNSQNTRNEAEAQPDHDSPGGYCHGQQEPPGNRSDLSE